jgi:hypothetical protein
MLKPEKFMVKSLYKQQALFNPIIYFLLLKSILRSLYLALQVNK